MDEQVIDSVARPRVGSAGLESLMNQSVSSSVDDPNFSVAIPSIKEITDSD